MNFTDLLTRRLAHAGERNAGAMSNFVHSQDTKEGRRLEGAPSRLLKKLPDGRTRRSRRGLEA